MERICKKKEKKKKHAHTGFLHVSYPTVHLFLSPANPSYNYFTFFPFLFLFSFPHPSPIVSSFVSFCRPSKNNKHVTLSITNDDFMIISFSKGFRRISKDCTNVRSVGTNKNNEKNPIHHSTTKGNIVFINVNVWPVFWVRVLGDIVDQGSGRGVGWY